MVDEQLLRELVGEEFKTRPEKVNQAIEDRIFYKKLTEMGAVKSYPLQMMFKLAAQQKLNEFPEEEHKGFIKNLAEELKTSQVTLYNYIKDERDPRKLKNKKKIAYYDIIRFVYNKANGEFVNIGLLIVDQATQSITYKFLQNFSRLQTFFNLSQNQIETVQEDIRLITEEISRYTKFDFSTLERSGYKFLCNFNFHIRRNELIDGKQYAFNKIYKHIYEDGNLDLNVFSNNLFNKYCIERN